jgi:predicted ATPase
VLPEVIRWFYDPERNPKNGQLWMSCHNASILEELEKEEVLFCEKDGEGRTRVYALQDIQGTRRANNHYKKYLGGEYGAVPHIG